MDIYWYIVIEGWNTGERQWAGADVDLLSRPRFTNPPRTLQTLKYVSWIDEVEWYWLLLRSYRLVCILNEFVLLVFLSLSSCLSVGDSFVALKFCRISRSAKMIHSSSKCPFQLKTLCQNRGRMTQRPILNCRTPRSTYIHIYIPLELVSSIHSHSRQVDVEGWDEETTGKGTTVTCSCHRTCCCSTRQWCDGKVVTAWKKVITNCCYRMHLLLL